MNDKRNYDMLTKFKGRNKKSSTSVGKSDALLLILKWGGELTPMGKKQAEDLGRAFRCVYPGGQGMEIIIILISSRYFCNYFVSIFLLFFTKSNYHNFSNV